MGRRKKYVDIKQALEGHNRSIKELMELCKTSESYTRLTLNSLIAEGKVKRLPGHPAKWTINDRLQNEEEELNLESIARIKQLTDVMRQPSFNGDPEKYNTGIIQEVHKQVHKAKKEDIAKIQYLLLDLADSVGRYANKRKERRD